MVGWTASVSIVERRHHLPLYAKRVLKTDGLLMALNPLHTGVDTNITRERKRNVEPPTVRFIMVIILVVVVVVDVAVDS